MIDRQKLLVPILLVFGIVAAFFREVVFAMYFGVSHQMEVFRLAFSIPNLFSQSVAPAFLGAVIPLLVATDAQGHKHRSLVARVINLNLLFSVLVAFLGIVFAPLLSTWMAPGFSQPELNDLTSQLRLGWLFFFIISGSFGLRAVLNTRGVYWPSAISPFIISISMVIACFAAGYLANITVWRASFLMKTGIAAGCVILVLHILQSRTTLSDYFKSFSENADESTAPIRVIALALSSVILFKVSYELPRVMDRAFGSEIQAGVVAALDYSFGIINVPGILFATSLITVAFPGFSKLIVKFSGIKPMRKYAGYFVVSVAAATVTGLIISYFSPTIIHYVYARGSFDQSASELTAELLKWHSLGLGPMVACLILSQALFAFRAHYLALAIVFLRILSKYVAIKLLVPSMGLSGLGLSFLVPELITLGGLLVVVAYLLRKANEQYKEH